MAGRANGGAWSCRTWACKAAAYSGSGKSTLARALSARLAIAHVELDALNGWPGWKNLSVEDPERWARVVAEAVAEDVWTEPSPAFQAVEGGRNDVLVDHTVDVAHGDARDHSRYGRCEQFTVRWRCVLIKLPSHRKI